MEVVVLVCSSKILSYLFVGSSCVRFLLSLILHIIRAQRLLQPSIH